MNIHKNALANALALAAGIYYAACYVLALIAPQLFLSITASWFHMIDIEKIARATTINPTQFILGLVTFTVNAWLFGYILGWSIEIFSKKK